MSLKFTDDQSTLVQVMAWCHQATRITRANVDPDLCHHMVSLDQNELIGVIALVFTRGQFWPSGIVVACVCLSVCPSVRQSRACPRNNSSPLSARITKFGP